MSELEDLMRQIEELRSRMIEIKEGKSFADPEVITASKRLDAILYKYEVTLMKMKAEKN